MKKLVLIDGYSILFRAFYAVRNLTKSDGTPTGALYGFARMLIKLITEIEYTHIAVVFDAGGKTFRNNIYPEYKANRPPCPPELLPQFPLVRELVNVLNIRKLEKIGYEADDLIATYTKKARQEDFDVMIVSSDKDLMQLVDDKVKMYDGMKDEIINIDKVKEKWGVEPIKVFDVLSLMGDNSDNVPGVAGIGPKTASELINEYGNIDNLIANIPNMKESKRKTNLLNGIDNIELSKKLIKLDDNVPVDYSITDLVFKQYNYQELFDFLNKYEFYSMVKGLRIAFNAIEKDLKEIKIIQKENNKIEEINEYTNLQNIINKIDDNNILYFYFLTDKIEYNSDVLNIIFSFNNIVYSIKVDNKKTDLFNTSSNTMNLENILSLFKNIFENNKILKISFDLKKVIKILHKYNIKINNFEDIGVINYIVNNGLCASNLSDMIEYNLKNESLYYNDNEINDKIAFIKNIEKDHKNIDNKEEKIKNTSPLIINSIKILYTQLKNILNKENLVSIYEDIEKPMTNILAKMEIEGIKIDIKKLQQLSNDFQEKIDILTKEIFNLAGEEFNIGSPKQLSHILFEKLNLSPLKKSSKSGNYSTGIDVLEELAEDGCEICKKILDWRHYTKLKNTYTDVLPTLIDKNNRIHTTYSNTNVITGRLSSNNPNLQNIPIKTEYGSKIREAFIAKDGYKLISADYKQAELRIIANYQNVKNLQDFFLEGKDIHKTTASKIFNIPENEISNETRAVAKAINFSIIYGTTAYGLAKRAKIDNKEAKQYLENYFNTYPEIKDYIDNIKKFVKENNYVKTAFGRKINIDIAGAKPIFRSNLERLSINAPIQGTASDIIKKAMIIIDKKLQNYKSKLILQIHDELVLECPNDEIDEVVNMVKDTMENVVDWKIKMDIDFYINTYLE